jgi:hypothetical protein
MLLRVSKSSDLNPNQRNLAHQLVAQADDLDTLNNIINNQIDLDILFSLFGTSLFTISFNAFITSSKSI